MRRDDHTAEAPQRREEIRATLASVQGPLVCPLSRFLGPRRALAVIAMVVLCVFGVSGRTQMLPEFQVTSLESATSLSLSAAAGDLDTDGDIDLVVVRDRHPSAIFLNNGDETFEILTLGLPSGRFTDVCLADLDGDGDLDVFIADKGGPNLVLFNDGAGKFVAVEQAWAAGPTAGMAVGDLDGDGDCDLLVAEYATPLSVWTNDGSGCFSNSGQVFGVANHRKPVLGDLDTLHGCHGCPDSLSINHQGAFRDTGQALSTGWSYSVAWADLDSDGVLDLFFSRDGAPDAIWWGRETIAREVP